MISNLFRVSAVLLLMLAGLRIGLPGQTRPSESAMPIVELVEEEYPSLFDLYRHLHAHPELSRQEAETSARLQQELKQVGFLVTSRVGGHGFVAVLKNGEGPTVMVRTDLDGLPVTEQTGLPYSSRVRTQDDEGNEVGVMHACGHDVHMACFVGTARLLSRMRNRWQGTLVMIGQPAEERGGGAKAMLDDGLFERFPRPDYVVALHDDAGLEAGKVGFCEGNALAGTGSVDVIIRGVSGHGAWPHMTKDPIVLASQTILAWQTIVSREIRPLDSAVVTVGSIHAGTKHNIIPDEVKLQLTIRFYSDEMKTHILESLERIARGLAQAAGLPPELAPSVKVVEGIDPTYNTPELTRRLRASAEAILGKENVVSREPVMGGEDFGLYGKTPSRIPICIFWLGAVNPDKIKQSRLPEAKPLPSLHSSGYAPDPEPTLKTGVKAMTAGVMDLFRR
ncbi:MAG: amidohydrolase [Acidobacteriota bacterium]